MLLKQISLSGTAVVVATHDYHIIRTFPSRIIKCESGKVLEDVQIA
jgi:cell division transport system ATP-binding protein